MHRRRLAFGTDAATTAGLAQREFGDDATQARPEVLAVVLDAARIAVRKERKRTKKGFLFPFFRLVIPFFFLVAKDRVFFSLFYKSKNVEVFFKRKNSSRMRKKGKDMQISLSLSLNAPRMLHALYVCGGGKNVRQVLSVKRLKMVKKATFALQ